MTLLNLLANLPPLATLRGLWLLLTPELVAILLERQAANGNGRNLVMPLLLADGRSALCADCLSEIGEDGLFQDTFQALDVPRFGEVTVVSTLPQLPDQPGI